MEIKIPKTNKIDTSMWTPVSVLPPERIRVITTNGRIVETGFYGRGSHRGCYKWEEIMWRNDRGKEEPFTNADGDVTYDRTHWMHLPDPPDSI